MCNFSPLECWSFSFIRRCSRKHNFPASSPTLLIKSMFTTFGMEQCRRDDYDPDASLEYSEEETYQQFLDFYDDVLPEFKNVGKVIQFKVGTCSARGGRDWFASFWSTRWHGKARAQALCLGGTCAMVEGLAPCWKEMLILSLSLSIHLIASTVEVLLEILNRY